MNRVFKMRQTPVIVLERGPKAIITLVLVVFVLSACLASSNASVLNNINNMLRDVPKKTKPLAIKNASTILSASAPASLGTKTDEQENNTEEYNDSSSAELLRFVDDNESVEDMVNHNSNDDVDNDDNDDENNFNTNLSDLENNDDNDSSLTSSSSLKSLSLEDQVRLLSKQLNVLMTRRREDYELLERNLLKSLRITMENERKQNSIATKINANIKNSDNNNWDLSKQLEQLRQEVQSLQTKHLGGNNERLTIEWLQQSVGELRKQLVELQQIASNAMRDVTTRTQSWEDLATIRSDFQQLKLELATVKERQQQTEVYIQELREETQQQEEDFRRLLQNKHQTQQQQQIIKDASASQDSKSSSSSSEETMGEIENIQISADLMADHKRRHCRYQRQQIHELQLAQRQLKRQFNELKYQRLGERVRSIEIEQHRIADANFNLSRQIASLDKLHSSMLELLEDVEDVQNKVDKNMPELRHEISKLEFSNAQLLSEQNIVREEGKNVARSVQALAVSISTLQEERDSVRRMQSSVSELRMKMDRLQSMLDDVQRALIYKHRGSIDKRDNKKYHNNRTVSAQNAETLVAKLENVEQEFESIIKKLPRDCSEVSHSSQPNDDGLFLIAPNGQPHHPMLAHCSDDGWTSIQRRYDGSADFNRSWEDYANGFGSPAGEFWIGNEQLHLLTLNNCTRLRVLMQDIYDNVWLAEYNQFYISSRLDGYRLHIDGYSGNASDALDYQQGMQFSAIDVDRDISQTHCAANYEGGWWFSHCQHANLNGRYNLGLTWFDAARNEWIAVKSSQMMIKRQPSAMCNYIAAHTSATTTTLPLSTTTWPSSSAIAVETISTSTEIPVLTIVSNNIPSQKSSRSEKDNNSLHTKQV